MAKKFIKKCAACVKFLKIRPMLLFFWPLLLPSQLSITRCCTLFEKTKNINESFGFSPHGYKSIYYFSKKQGSPCQVQKGFLSLPTLSYLIVANLPILRDLLLSEIEP